MFIPESIAKGLARASSREHTCERTCKTSKLAGDHLLEQTGTSTLALDLHEPLARSNVQKDSCTENLRRNARTCAERLEQKKMSREFAQRNFAA